MRRVALLLCITVLCGCGIFRKSSKDKSLSSTQTTIRRETKSNDLTIDRSKITIKEKADTIITTPAKQTSGQTRMGLNVDSLVNGLTAISNDLVDVKLVLDSTGILHTTAYIKPQRVNFNVDRETTIDKDVTSHKDVDSKERVATKYESKVVNKASEPTSIGLWVWLGMGAIVGIVLYFIIRR